MSQAIVLERVYQKCLGITGIVSVHPNGRPFPEDEPPMPGSPAMVLDVLDSEPETANLSGNKWHNYEILMTLYIGPPDMTHSDASAIALPMVDLLLAAFNADPFLLTEAGAKTCFNSDLGPVVKNLDTYQAAGECPKQQAKLLVTEYV